MSASFNLVIGGAHEQLSFSSCLSFSFSSLSTIFFIFFTLCMQSWGLKQALLTDSMRLRSKRIGSGVECFGGFLIKRFLHLFLFLRGVPVLT